MWTFSRDDVCNAGSLRPLGSGTSAPGAKQNSNNCRGRGKLLNSLEYM